VLFIIGVYVTLYFMDLCKLRQKLVVSISQDIPLVVMYTQRLNHCASCGVSLHSRFCSPGREHHSCQTCGAPKELIREAANTRLSLHVRREWRITFMMGATFVLFMTCQLPLTIIIIVNFFSDGSVMSPTAIWLTFLHSACNIIVFFISNPDFRREVQKYYPV
jgi:hypothetical protein